jgi:hypothetical protein
LHTWERREKCTRKERDHSEAWGVDGMRKSLREIGWGDVEWIQLAQDRDWW